MGEHSWLPRSRDVNETEILKRITINPEIFGGKPIIRGRRLAVEHVLGMLVAGDTPEILLQGYDWLEPEDIKACLLYATRLVNNARIELPDGTKIEVLLDPQDETSKEEERDREHRQAIEEILASKPINIRPYTVRDLIEDGRKY